MILRISTALFIAVTLLSPQSAQASQTPRCDEIKRMLDDALRNQKAVIANNLELTLLQALEAGLRRGNPTRNGLRAELYTAANGKEIAPDILNEADYDWSDPTQMARALESVRSKIARKKSVQAALDDEQYYGRLINRLEEQLIEFKCEGAPKRPNLNTGSSGGGGGGTPPTQPNVGGDGSNATGGSNAPGSRTATIDLASWPGYWTLSSGALTLVQNADAAYSRSLAAVANGLGPALDCPEGAIALDAEIVFADSTSARGVACATTKAIDLKFSNLSSASAAEIAANRVKKGRMKATVKSAGPIAFEGTLQIGSDAPLTVRGTK